MQTGKCGAATVYSTVGVVFSLCDIADNDDIDFHALKDNDMNVSFV